MTLMHRLPSFLLSLVILGWVAAAAAAQESPLRNPQKAEEEKAAAQKALEAKALALLDEIITQSLSLKLPENRIRVQAEAAELLWPRDEKRARALFVEAMTSLSALINSFDPADPRYYQLIQAPTQLRHQMMYIASQRDPKLALDFLRATRLPVRQQGGPGQVDSEAQLELSLGSMIATKDPKIALQIAEESLTKGLSNQATQILENLINLDQDRDAATKLMGSIVKKLRTENILTNHEAASVLNHLLNLGLRQQQAAREQASNKSPSNRLPAIPAIIDESTLRQLLEMVSAAAQKGALNQQEQNGLRNLLAMTQHILPQLEKYAPTTVTALRGRAAELDKSQDERNRISSDFQKLAQHGTVDAMLEVASKAPPEIQNNLYQQMAWKVFNDGGAERARQIINDNVSDPGQRAWMLAELDRQAFWRAANEGKLEEARQSLTRLRSMEERVGMTIQLATTAAGKGDKKLALQLLDEARSVLGQRAENQSQIQAQFQLAGAYAGLDPARGFALLEPISGQLNEIIAASAVLDGFQQGGGFREGEMLMYGGSFANNLVQQYATGLVSLARADFDHAKSVADQLEREEARLSVRFMVAQGVLRDQAGTGRGGGIGIGSSRGRSGFANLIHVIDR